MKRRTWNIKGAQGEHWPTTVGYFATFVAVGLQASILGPTLPPLAEHTHSPLGEISFLFTAAALGYLLGSYFGGRLYDRIAGHPLMSAMLVLMAAMLALIPVIPTLWLLTIAWLFVGVASGALDVGGNTLLVWLHGRQVGPYMNALHFFFGVGSFLAPLMVAQALVLSGDIRGAYWILSALMLPVALWLLRLPSPRSPAHAGDPLPGDSQPAGASTAGVEQAEPAQVTARQRYERRIVVFTCLLLLLYVGAEVAFGGWIYTYAVALGLTDATTAAYLTSAFWGALTLGRFLSIPLATRFRPRMILLTDLLGCLASVGVLLLWPGSAAATWLGALAMGLAMASIFPTCITLAGRRIPITGRVTGWFLVSSSLGGMSLPWLIGQLFEPIGPQITMGIILLDLVAALIAYTALMRTDLRRPLTEQIS
jgi:FHS family Na+ dependent glucose MFS transporter 1